MYQYELARSGKALFQIRGLYMYALIAVGTLLVYVLRIPGPFGSPGADRAWCWAAFGVAFLGLAIRTVTNGYAALGTSGKAKKGAEALELNTTGPYSLVRNPLYLGRILNFTGIALLTGIWWYGAIVLLLSIIVYERISIYEEQFLIDKFGDAHRAWAAEVPALFPRLHGYVPPRYPFWWRRMFWREYKKVFQLATAIFLYAAARRGFDWHVAPADLGWVYVYAGFVVARLLVSFLRHFTGFFRGLS